MGFGCVVLFCCGLESFGEVRGCGFVGRGGFNVFRVGRGGVVEGVVGKEVCGRGFVFWFVVVLGLFLCCCYVSFWF